MDFNDTTRDFILQHHTDDVYALALQAGKYPGVDMPAAITQIAGWQAARNKIPSWAAQEDICYPAHLPLEQCSSETTARHKSAIIAGKADERNRLADLTGGFGIDFAFMAPLFCHADYVERQEALCALARHNFPLLGLPEHNLLNMARVAGLALICALVSILFCVCMHQAGHWYKRLLKNPYLRVAVGAVLVIGLTLLCGTRDYNGAGMDVVARALAGQSRPEAFLLKILFTAFTLGAGFKGGEIVPSFFIGATLGCAVGPLLGLDPAFAAAIGLVAVFCGVVNCPMASLVLSMELFGGSGMLLFALACAVSYLMSGPFSLYSSQKLVYSKLEPTFVNSKTL